MALNDGNFDHPNKYPGFVIRDVLQFDLSLTEAIDRITGMCR